MRGVPVSRIRLGLSSALWYATPRAKLRAFKFTPSTCGNSARNSIATMDEFSLLDRGVSNYLKGNSGTDWASFMAVIIRATEVSPTSSVRWCIMRIR